VVVNHDWRYVWFGAGIGNMNRREAALYSIIISIGLLVSVWLIVNNLVD
jgi:hypothetical protein